MPTLQLTVTKDAFSQEEKAEIIEVLTNAFCDHAMKKGKGDIRKHVAVQIFETAKGGYAVCGMVYG